MDHLNQLFQRVSLEARVSDNNQVTFGSHFGKLVDGLTNHATGMLGNNIFSFNGDLGKVSSKGEYMAIRTVTVYRPIHLRKKTSMLDFAEAVKEVIEAQEDIESRVLAPWRAILSNFLTNPTELQRIYDTKDLKNGKLMKFTDLEALEKKLKKVYDASSNQVTDSFGDLYGNHSEWKETTKITAALNEQTARMGFKSIVGQIEELHAMAGRLAGYIASDDERYKASPTALQLLNQGSFSVGKELEFLGASGAMLQALSGAIASTLEALKK